METRHIERFAAQPPARRHGRHFLGGLLLAVGALLAACDTNGGQAPGGPVETAVKFFAARQVSNCGEVWPLYSAGTQENLRAVAHRRERERDGLPQVERPEELACSRTGTLKRGSTRLVRQQGDAAVVAGDFIVEAPRNRYDMLFPPKVVVTEELQLLREAGAWRVELPRMEIGPGSGRQLVEIGPVDVLYPETFFVGLADRLEATAVVRAARDTLEPALRDPQTWARLLPAVKMVQPLERVGELERVQLGFAEPERTLTVATGFSGKDAAWPLSQSSRHWDAEGGNYAPVYFRGSWTLQPHQDGSTRVTLLLIMIHNQWPGNVATGIFSPERMAQALLDLESTARQTTP